MRQKHDVQEYEKVGPVYRALAGLIAAIGLLGFTGAILFSDPSEFNLGNKEFVRLIVPSILSASLTVVCSVVAIRGYPPKFFLFMLRPKE